MNIKTYLRLMNHRRQMRGSSRNRLPTGNADLICLWLLVAALLAIGIYSAIESADWAGSSANRIAELERAECDCTNCGGSK